MHSCLAQACPAAQLGNPDLSLCNITHLTNICLLFKEHWNGLPFLSLKKKKQIIYLIGEMEHAYTSLEKYIFIFWGQMYS